MVLIRTFTNFGRGIVFSADVCYNGRKQKAFLREEGGTRQGFPEANEMSFGGSLRSVTEGACVILGLYELHCDALSLTRLRRELPPGGSLWYAHASLGVWALPDASVACNAVIQRRNWR